MREIMVLTLYKLDASPPVRSVLMVIHAANIPDVKFVDVNFFAGDHLKEEYLKLNPQHTIPILTDDDFAIWDSHAIAVYLLTLHSNNKSLYPTDAKKRAVIDQRLHFDSGILFPSLRGALEPVLFKGEKAIRPEALEKIKSAYDFSEKFLINTWMAGNDLTLADICCVSSISTLNEIIPIDAKLYPQLTAWFERCKEQEFYKKGNEPGVEQIRGVLKSKLG
ncbi:unnamed protein product [Parnassius apollo]|uniref:(apollo) hypothetical protein n=1 Tax=Parnassius apollo TaxID=110799 RepID=A0A8S3WIP5_PARAO|nr:unnamed protein product [Parnassius apollo]